MRPLGVYIKSLDFFNEFLLFSDANRSYSAANLANELLRSGAATVSLSEQSGEEISVKG